jgi:site-specific DNA-methyltransferase (adenine-specific)
VPGTILHADSFEILPVLAATDEPFHGIVTDPPYGLGSWDWIKDGRSLWVWHVEWAEKALDCVYPGAHMAVFSGTRHFHHMMAAIEYAGWELRDTLLWLKAGGMPKSRNRGEYGTGLKPGWEPIALFRKPLDGTIFATFDKYETGMLHIDALRTPTDDKLGGGDVSEKRGGRSRTEVMNPKWLNDPEMVARHAAQIRENVKKAEKLGRWPANVILDVDAAEELDLQTGDRTAGGSVKQESVNSEPGKNVYGKYGKERAFTSYDDAGGASRFFFVAKAAPGEREVGLLGKVPCRGCGQLDSERHEIDGKDGRCHRNGHPTVKPIKLIQWLDRMLIVPGGRILDPFAGVASAGCAAELDGFAYTGIEKDPDDEGFVQTGIARMEYWASVADS